MGGFQMGGKPNAKWYGYDHMRNILWKEVYMGLDHACSNFGNYKHID